MKITVLANRDLPANFALNHLIPQLIPLHDVKIFLSSHVGGSQNMPSELVDLAFFEQTLFNDMLFPALDRSLPDENSADPRPGLLSFEALGRLTGRSVEVLNRVNASASMERLRASAPDLILSIRYGSILRDPAIAVPTNGVLNLHSGLLPNYRGVMATFRALQNGDPQIGTTLHTIDDAGIDTGRVIGRTRLPVERGKSYLWHVLALYPEGCRLMLEAVSKIDQGQPLETQDQGEGGAYYSFPSQSELDDFRRAGWALYKLDEMTDFTRPYLPG